MTDTKRCSCCGDEKPLTAFAKHAGNPPLFLQAYCRECGLIKSRAWAAKNKAAKAEHKRKSRAADPERDRAVKRAHYARHADKLREQSRKRTPEQRAKRAERQKEYRRQNPAVIRNLNRARVHSQRGAGKVTRAVIDMLIKLQKGCCAVCACATVTDGKGFHLDHIQPLALGGTSDAGNLQILCPPCNLAKSARDPLEFMQSRGKLL